VPGWRLARHAGQAQVHDDQVGDGVAQHAQGVRAVGHFRDGVEIEVLGEAASDGKPDRGVIIHDKGGGHGLGLLQLSDARA